MRKITVISMISLDGVMQAPGGPKEDKSGGFKYGGWTVDFGDELFGKNMQKELEQSTDYLLGKKTFEIFANYWPQHAEFWPGINKGMKYVISKKIKKTDPLVTGWKNSMLIKSVADIRKIKKSKGADIQVWGSSQLVQLLLKNDLVDELRLKIYPVTLGKGKKLFGEAAIPATLKLTESITTSKGVIIASYKRFESNQARKIKTGTVGV